MRVELLVDLSRNGIITEHRRVSPDGHYAVRRGEFEQTDGGIWLPRYMENKEEGLALVQLDLSAKANISFPDDIFVLEFVPGYEVRDRIAGVSFTAGFESDNAMLQHVIEAIGEVEAARDAPSEPAAPAASGAQLLEAETLPEARRRWLWLLAPAFVMIAAAAAAALVLLKRHADVA